MGSLGPELMPDSDGVPPFNRQRLDVLSNRPLPLVLASCGEPSIMRYSILVPRLPVLRSSFIVSFIVYRLSLSVPRFQLLVFRFRVPRSQFDTTALLSLSIYTFFSPFRLSSVGSSFSSLPSVPLDVMTFTSC
jgi:hypothetical protein